MTSSCCWLANANPVICTLLAMMWWCNVCGLLIPSINEGDLKTPFSHSSSSCSSPSSPVILSQLTERVLVAQWQGRPTKKSRGIVGGREHGSATSSRLNCECRDERKGKGRVEPHVICHPLLIARCFLLPYLSISPQYPQNSLGSPQVNMVQMREQRGHHKSPGW